ncbi:C1 family peptidase [Chitinivorax sp. B]|uniref:C1 family peptidase n=1 Tax=Chitinivorax sp. B TaxID=2502235 RepID=UPI0010F75ABD|nr:C1 family peptidase [Chitinivorax sp. B]
MEENAPAPIGTHDKDTRPGLILEWVKVLLPVFVSWPAVGLVTAVLFHDSLSGLIARFSQSTDGKAELGPLKIELGAPVLPPQFRTPTPARPEEVIDLSTSIGPIGDTGPEAATVGFTVAYAIQSKAASIGKQHVTVSPRGIYMLAKQFDEFQGEDYQGTSLLGALKAAQSVGIYLASDWPYSLKTLPNNSVKPAFKLKSFAQTKSISQVLDALRSGNVVAAAIEVPNDFDTPGKGGKVTVKLPLRTLGLKTIAIVGYDTNTAEFKFANDWGTNWGAQGFGTIKDTDLARILMDGYTVDL